MSQTQDPIESQYDSQSDLAFLDFSANTGGSQANTQSHNYGSQLNPALNQSPEHKKSQITTTNATASKPTSGSPSTALSASSSRSTINALPRKPKAGDRDFTHSQAAGTILDTQTQNDMHSQLPSMDARGFETQSQITQQAQFMQSQNRKLSGSMSKPLSSALPAVHDHDTMGISEQPTSKKSKRNMTEEEDDDDLALEFQQFDDQNARRRSHNATDYSMEASQSQTQTQAETLDTQLTNYLAHHHDHEPATKPSQITEASQSQKSELQDASEHHSHSHTEDGHELNTASSSTHTHNESLQQSGHSKSGVIQQYDLSRLPGHACAYCGIHSTSCVVRCDVCEKWFCNARTNNSAGTHIIHHLVRSKHKYVSLHRDCPIGETNLECYNCGTRNIFLLGFVPATSDGVVVLLCREQCLHIEKLREMEWDGSNWQPLIRDRELLDWLVQYPTQIELARSRQISTEQMNALEELWKTNPNAKHNNNHNHHNQYAAGDHHHSQHNGADSSVGMHMMSDMDKVDRMLHDEQVEHVLITYEDAQHFQRIYSPLVKLEGDYDKNMKESQSLENVEIRWDFNSLGKKRLIHFKKSSYRNTTNTSDLYSLSFDGGNANQVRNANVYDSEFRVVPGDELLIRHLRSGWQCNGVVSSVADDDNNDDISVELRTATEKNTAPITESHGFRVEFVWKSTSFDRQQLAMKTLIVDDYSVTAYLYHLLMGHEVVPQILEIKNLERRKQTDDYNIEDDYDEEDDDEFSEYEFNAPGLPKLNHSQQAAVRHCLQQPLSLIQGPPGTGKTVTSATIVYHLTKQNQGQVLVAAPSNIAVDQLTMKIHQTGLKVVRLAAKSREAVSSSVDFLCLHNLVIQVAEIQNNELYKWHKLLQEMGELTPKDNLRYRRLVRETEKKLLQSADVICVTCVGAGDPRLKDFRFKQVLIDESTQATEPECLIPIVMGSKQIVLVGDHCQLGPVIMCKKAAQAGLQRSLFERLILLNIKPVRLQVQYRMHPCLSEFPSNTFYEGSLQNGVSKEQRSQPLLADFWPNPSKPMFFYSSMGREEFAASGTSYLNRVEAQNVEKIITKLLRMGIKPTEIGVVTPYEGQRQYILSYMARKGTLKESIYESIEVASVDAFQGREKNYIILSCVRSNNNQGIGFLNDPRRLNVSLTRAKFGVIVIGNPTVLSRQTLWNNLLTHFKSLGLLVEGDLNHLKQCMIQLASIKKYFHRKRHLQPVMPRTFGDQIPQRRFNQDAQGYGNRNQFNHHNNSSNTQQQTPTAPQQQHQLSAPTQTQLPSAQTDSVPLHESIRPPALPQQHQLNTYAYPGMITPSDLGLPSGSNSNATKTQENEWNASAVSQDEHKQSVSPPEERNERSETDKKPNKSGKPRANRDMIDVSRPSVPIMSKNGDDDDMPVVTDTQLTQDDQMEIITASQVDRIRNNALRRGAHKSATSPSSQMTQFASLGLTGLTQDPQIQDIVQQMDEISKLSKEQKRKNRAQKK